MALGTWVPLVNQAPGDICDTVLLPDGSVMGADLGDTAKNWYRLTPDAHASYINGTWSKIASMHDARDFYATQVLTDGRVFVAGGENGDGQYSAEVYDSLLDNWTMCPGSGAWILNSPSEILPNGYVLIAPVGPTNNGETMLYNPGSNAWIAGPTLYRGHYEDEATWVKLPDNSILTIDTIWSGGTGTNSERYIPSLNQWINDANVPVNTYGNVRGMGPAFLLPTGNAFMLGGGGDTAIYIPSGSTNMGTWVAGPVLPDNDITGNTPAAMMVNGKILCVFNNPENSSPSDGWYEYDPFTNSFIGTSNPGIISSSTSSCNDFRMLDLPDGSVLFSYGNSGQLYVYQPDGTALTAGRPTIITITTNFYRSYHLTGTLLNGISEGASYGGDAEMNSNYPLARMTNNATGNVYYARTYNWSSTGVMTGTNIVSTEFMVPANLPAGNYSLVVVANGNSSAPVSFTFNSDPLSISLLTGLASIGPIGGPFSPAEQAYFLSNTGALPLNWSLINTSAWLNVSATGGTLPSGGQSTIIVTSSSMATNLAAGMYAASIWFSNFNTGCAQSVPFSLEVTPLVQNGGFETGSFADWSFSGNIRNSYVASAPLNNDPTYSHSGYFSAFLGFNTSFGYLSQTISTIPGQSYLLSFFLDSPSGTGSTNEFAVSWDVLTLLDEQSFTTRGWQQLQFIVEATGDSTELEFTFDNATNFFRLDDVVLTNLPPTLFIASQPTSQVIPTGGNATFSVLVGGPPPFTYCWMKNGTNLLDGGNIFGSGTANLSVISAAASDAGNYSVVVGSGSLSVTSVLATLTVIGISPNCAMSAPTGLIAWWPANLTANDIAGTNNGTLENGVTYAPGEVGYAFSVNGVNQYVSVPDSASLTFSNGAPYTLGAWVFRINNTLPFQFLGKRDPANPFYPSFYQLGYDQSSPNVPRNVWTLLVDTFDGATYSRYYNGSLVESYAVTPVTNPPPSVPLTIGASGGYSGFQGYIDEVQIYNRALSAAEIRAIYQAGTNGMCLPTPLMFTGPLSYSKANGIILNASLRSGQSYSLQANTNLASTNWISLMNFTAGTAPVSHFTNNGATNISEQFYRIVSP